MISATQHDRHIGADYQRLHAHGITTVRDGIRWHVIEQRPGEYDWQSVLPMLRAARDTGTQVIWDVCHYGWPDDLDLFGSDFVPRFAAFARAFAALVAQETDDVPFYTPINEISFFSWAAGDVGYLNPFATRRGFELKVQLVRAALAAIDAIWQVDPRARIVHAEPLINIIPGSEHPHEREWVERYRQAQFEALDMVSGQLWPQLGGHPRYLDIIGVNYYSNNQWIHNGSHIGRTHPQYRPFRDLLREIYDRYRRPLFIAETGCEDEARPEWLHYVAGEVRAAMHTGVPVEGICLYPIVNHPGWDDDRHCQNGLFDYPDEAGNRAVYRPLAQAIRAERPRFDALRPATPSIVSTPAVQRAHTEHYIPTVCLHTASLEPSGMGEVMVTLATALHPHVRLLFVCPPSAQGTPMLNRVAALGTEVLPIGPQGRRSATDVLARWLRERQVDIFHTHAGIGWEGHRSTIVAREVGVPVVIRTEHLPYLITHWRQRAEHAQLVRVLDRLVCVGKDARQTFIEAGVPRDKLHVLRNGIIPKLPQRDCESVRAALELAPADRLVLTVGRLAEQKGYDVLFAALPTILAQQPHTCFVWVGEGELLEEMQGAVRALGLAQHVRVLGRRTDVPDLLAAADLFVLPSRFEGLPLGALEAMAAGLPVVATRVCGTTEVVLDGVTGRLVAPNNVPALAAAVLEALTQPLRITQWGAAGRARMQREFSAARMVQDTLALYHELLNTCGRAESTEHVEQGEASMTKVVGALLDDVFITRDRSTDGARGGAALS